MDVALIIAGNSFVGRHLRRQLTLRGISHRATSRLPGPALLACDLTRPGETDALLRIVRPRWIFACAGATAQGSAEQLHALHVNGTEALLEAAARRVPAAVTVLFGSAAEYGPVPPERLPIREEMSARPDSPYGRSKLAQLHVAEHLARDRSLRVLIVRPFNLLGPGLGPQFLAASLCERLRRAREQGHRGPISVPNGHATRDWVDVRDAADAVVRLALDAPPAPGSVGLYNIATGEETAVLALADHLCRLEGDFHAVNAGPAGSRSGIDRSCGDATRLRAATGWQPRISWQQSAEELWKECIPSS
jgi:GDP-4-dehydro-6-deoxy-D-mannose reductase